MSDYDDDGGGGGGIIVFLIFLVGIIVAALIFFKPKPTPTPAPGPTPTPAPGPTPTPGPSPGPAPAPAAQCTSVGISYLDLAYSGKAQVSIPNPTNGDIFSTLISTTANGDSELALSYINGPLQVDGPLFGLAPGNLTVNCLQCIGTVPLMTPSSYAGTWSYYDENMNLLGPAELTGCVSLGSNGEPAENTFWSLVETPMVQYPEVLQTGTYWNKYYKSTTDPNDPDCMISWQIYDTSSGATIPVNGRLSTYYGQGSWCMRNRYISAANESNDIQNLVNGTVWKNCDQSAISPHPITTIRSKCA